LHDVEFDLALARSASPDGKFPSDVEFDAEMLSVIEPPPSHPPVEDAAFGDAIAARAAMDEPVVLDKPSQDVKLRDWQIDFGPAWAPAGSVSTITIAPQCLFRGEKITATDTAPTPGTGTRILQVAVGQKVQKARTGNGTLTSMFASTALANGIKFDTAQRWSRVAVTVSWVQSVTFDMSVFGSCVVDL
jgi:hypothetical protein